MPNEFVSYYILAVIFWSALVLMLVPRFRISFIHLFLQNAPRSQSHLPGLDGLRGLAALFVAIFHTWQWTQPFFHTFIAVAPFVVKGSKAVPIFVALSGFLIYRSLYKAYDVESIRYYFKRRFLRIYPVYFATVITSAIAFGENYTIEFPLVQYLISELFMLRIFGSTFFSNPQSWSLYVEVLFYLVVPLVTIIPINKRLKFLLIILMVFIFGDISGPRETSIWKYFIFGMLASEITIRRLVNGKFGTVVASIGILIIIMDLSCDVDCDFISKSITYIASGSIILNGGANTLTLGVGLFATLVGVVKSKFYSRLLDSSALRFLGAISYSIFLWHSFLISLNFRTMFDGRGSHSAMDGMFYSKTLQLEIPIWFIPIIVIPALIAISSISYLIIERPFLIRRDSRIIKA